MGMKDILNIWENFPVDAWSGDQDEIIFDNSRNHKNYVLFSGKVWPV